MYIMPSSCFSSNTKPLPSPIKPKVPDHDGIFEKFIIDNPFIFRVCCFCISRRRKRVDTAKVNGNGHNDIHERNSDDTVLTIDQIEFTRSTIDLNENAKSIGNELTIQPLTLSIGLVESDDGSSVQNAAPPAQPSAKSNKSEEVTVVIADSEDLTESCVEEQGRRTSLKTNSHILSDIESSPMHLPEVSTSNEIYNVRNEIAQIQSAIKTVKREMEEMQKQKSTNNTPCHKISRPPSANSNKTFICELDETDTDAAFDHHDHHHHHNSSCIIQPDEEIEEHIIMPQKSRPSTSKSLLEESPFKRVATPAPEEIITDDQICDSPCEPIIEMPPEEETEDVSEHINEETDEGERSSIYIDPEAMRSDSTMTLSRENVNVGFEEGEDTVGQFTDHDVTPSPIPEARMKIQRGPMQINRPAVLKRSHKTTPVRNPMPKINQLPTVVIKSPKRNTLFPENLRRFERPKEAASSTMQQLESPNWEDVMEGLKNFVRLIRHHPEYVDAQIHLFTLGIAKQVKNLRSQVSRAGCTAAGEFFITHAKTLDGDAEELAAALLNRSADTNKFLRADASLALESMCDALHPSKSIMILSFRGAKHQNAAVRCTTAKLLNQLVFRIGCDKVFNLHRDIRDRLILTGANLLMEGSLETRNHTKELFKQLSIHSHYQKILLDVIPSNIYRNIEKSLKSIR